MRFDWSTLGAVAPAALADARLQAHCAAQWPTRAARANLAAVPDDSHSSLQWSPAHAALLSQPLPARGGAVRVGVRIAPLDLCIVRDAAQLDGFGLDAREDAAAGVWLDSALLGLGLEPASGVALPYSIPGHPVGKGAPYDRAGEADALAELARWYAASAELLADFAAPHAGPDSVRCWPHHFDIAISVALEQGDPETARSVGIGVSPGDEYYAQPYAYVSPWPRPDAARLPALPAPGRWHTRDFVAAVVTGEQILALSDRRAGLRAVIDAAFEFSRAR